MQEARRVRRWERNTCSGAWLHLGDHVLLRAGEPREEVEHRDTGAFLDLQEGSGQKGTDGGWRLASVDGRADLGPCLRREVDGKLHGALQDAAVVATDLAPIDSAARGVIHWQQPARDRLATHAGHTS